MSIINVVLIIVVVSFLDVLTQ